MPAMYSARSAIIHLANTVATLPPSVHTVRLLVDVAMRNGNGDVTGFTDPLDIWPLLWEQVAAKPTIRIFSLEFSESERSIARFNLDSRQKEWECQMSIRAFLCLVTSGFAGGKMVSISHTLSSC